MSLNSWKEHSWYKVPCVRARIEEIVRRVGPNVSVLDAGCAEGFLSKALLENMCRVVSVDLSSDMIDKSKELFKLNAIKADVTSLPFKNDYFDVVVAGELLEHIGNPGLALTELFRVSRMKVVMSLPIGSYWLGEKTHLWELGATTINHDVPVKRILPKDFIVLEFIKRR